MYYYIGNSVHSHLRNLVVRKEECKETLKEYIYFDNEEDANKFKELLEQFFNLKDKNDIDNFCDKLKQEDTVEIIKNKLPK